MFHSQNIKLQFLVSAARIHLMPENINLHSCILHSSDLDSLQKHSKVI